MKAGVLTVIPVLCLFTLTTILVLAARAPRTWAAHWSSPHAVGRATGQGEYGAVYRGGRRWDVLWVDDDSQTLQWTESGKRSLVVDRGDVAQPALVRANGEDVAAWVHNGNGWTDLMVGHTEPGGGFTRRVLIHSVSPLEHPYLFAGPKGTVDAVFSWQRPNNFDIYLLTLTAHTLQPMRARQLSHGPYYDFYPRATVDGAGHIDVIYLEECCNQLAWNVQFGRFDSHGRALQPVRRLFQFQDSSNQQYIPSQWAEDLHTDSSGSVIGIFSGGDLFVFKVDKRGTVVVPPRDIAPADNPEAVSMSVAPSGDFVFWEQTYELGTYLASQRLDPGLRPIGPQERVVYESATETNPHAAVEAGKPVVLWQAIASSLGSRFETAQHVGSIQPSLAERLGLGLGNPWEALAILLVGAFGIATITTMGNILTIFVFIGLGLVMLRLLRRVPARWPVFMVLLTAALYLTFVTPGGPILFLVTMPSIGLPAVPFGLAASAGALFLTLWLGIVAMRRIEDFFRACALVTMGVYFFAFIEAIVLVQQRLGYI